MSDIGRVGFVGNRFGILSYRIFRGAAAAAAAQGIDLVLVDSSTARDAAWTTRLRNRVVRVSKRILRAETVTEAGDWFHGREAQAYPRRTPRGHDLNEPGFARSLAREDVSAVLVAGCDQILREPFLSAIPRIVNFHNSLLPDYRGVNAISWAFLNREPVSGFTFHTIESEAIDLGRIVVQGRLPILPDDTPVTYSSRLLDEAAAAAGEVLRALAASAWPPDRPPLEGGSYFGRKAMAAARRFDPELPVDELVHRARVLGSLDAGEGRRPLRLSRLEAATGGPNDEPGSWRARRDGAIAVRCRDGWVRIGRIEHLPAAVLAFRLPRRLRPAAGR